MNKTLTAALVVASMALGACATTQPPPEGDPLLVITQQRADAMASQLRLHSLTAPLIVTSAQNNDQLSDVCQQGRLIADIVSSRLTQNGFPVTEVRLSNRLTITAEGETMLSREVRDLAAKKKVDAVVTATWTIPGPAAIDLTGQARVRSEQNAYVSLRAVRAADGLVLASQVFQVPVTGNCAR